MEDDTPALIRLLAVLLELRLWKARMIWVHLDLGGKGGNSFSVCKARELFQSRSSDESAICRKAAARG